MKTLHLMYRTNPVPVTRLSTDNRTTIKGRKDFASFYAITYLGSAGCLLLIAKLRGIFKQPVIWDLLFTPSTFHPLINMTLTFFFLNPV